MAGRDQRRGKRNKTIIETQERNPEEKQKGNPYDYCCKRDTRKAVQNYPAYG